MIYIRSLDWYLSLDEDKDYIEFSVKDNLDISGWDLKKALKLFRKSNPSLMEWLDSPIKYLENGNVIEQLRLLAKVFFNSKIGMYHYLHMAIGNYREYLKRDLVRVKKYFYVLRPLLACQWIINRDTMPPIEFEILLKTQLKHSAIKDKIIELLQRKRSGEEMDEEPRIEILNSFIEERIRYFSNEARKAKKIESLNQDKLNILFRKALNDSPAQLTGD